MMFQWQNLIDDADAGDSDAAAVVLLQARRSKEDDIEQQMLDILIDVAVTDSDEKGRAAVRSLISYASYSGRADVFCEAVALAFAGADEQNKETGKRRSWIQLIQEIQASPLYLTVPCLER